MPTPNSYLDGTSLNKSKKANIFWNKGSFLWLKNRHMVVIFCSSLTVRNDRCWLTCCGLTDGQVHCWDYILIARYEGKRNTINSPCRKCFPFLAWVGGAEGALQSPSPFALQKVNENKVKWVPGGKSCLKQVWKFKLKTNKMTAVQ